MKPLQDALKQVSKDTNFLQTYQEITDRVLSEAVIVDFIQKNTLSEASVQRNIGVFYEYLSQLSNCSTCQGLAACENVVSGYIPKLVYMENNVRLMYEICDKKRISMERAELKKLVRSMYIPKEILGAKLEDLYLNNISRVEVMEKIQQVVQCVEEKKPFRGLYLSGSFGVGKTFILGVLANRLAEKGISSLIVYFPEFVREMKSSISDQTLEQKLNVVKEAPVLMIDDIGAEAVSDRKSVV